MKKQNGITLLAMLITMGVMLLIVGITVAILVNNSKSDIEYSIPQEIAQPATKVQEDKKPEKIIEPIEDDIPEEDEPIEDEPIEEEPIDDLSDLMDVAE